VIGALFFWCVVALTLTGAALAAFTRNLVHAGLGLGLCLLGVGALGLYLGCEYVAAVQVLVYVGGILVLLLFAMLYARDLLGRGQPTPQRIAVGSAAVALLLFLGLAGVIVRRVAQQSVTVRDGAVAGEVQAIGDLLLHGWLGGLLFIAVLLTLVAVIAVALVRKEQRPLTPDTGETHP
jgi:NADH-quinone oxidoreductase subunit J